MREEVSYGDAPAPEQATLYGKENIGVLRLSKAVEEQGEVVVVVKGLQRNLKSREVYSNKSSDRSMEVKLPALIGNYDRPTDTGNKFHFQ